jgi:hypothetical protein
MFPQKDAIVRLLRDDDPLTVNLVKQQLTEKGPDAIPSLEDLLSIDDEAVTRHVKEVLGEIDARKAAEELTALCRVFPNVGDIEQASWMLARAFIPGLAVRPFQRQLDNWGRRLGNMIGGIRRTEDRVRLMANFLGDQLGFRGNSKHYYKADNSLLPRVIETRLGIPISLSLIYAIIGRRAGMEIEGVNFPGHFFVRHDRVMFDPFERGRIMSIEDCEQILARQKLKLERSYLDTAPPRLMLRRLLANLLHVFQTSRDETHARKVAVWIHALERK